MLLEGSRVEGSPIAAKGPGWVLLSGPRLPGGPCPSRGLAQRRCALQKSGSTLISNAPGSLQILGEADFGNPYAALANTSGLRLPHKSSLQRPGTCREKALHAFVFKTFKSEDRPGEGQLSPFSLSLVQP